MLFVPTASFLAADAQRRHFAGARLDGPSTVETASASRFSVARLLGRKTDNARSGSVVGRRQFA